MRRAPRSSSSPHLRFKFADTMRLLDLSVEPLLRLVEPKSKLARRAPDGLHVAESGYFPERVIDLDKSKMIERRNRDRHRNETERRREPLFALAQRALCLRGSRSANVNSMQASFETSMGCPATMTNFGRVRSGMQASICGIVRLSASRSSARSRCSAAFSKSKSSSV